MLSKENLKKNNSERRMNWREKPATRTKKKNFKKKTVVLLLIKAPHDKINTSFNQMKWFKANHLLYITQI